MTRPDPAFPAVRATARRLVLLGGALALTGCGFNEPPLPPETFDPFARHPLGVTAGCAYNQLDPKQDPKSIGDPAFGCAHQNNITVMLADPADIERPRALSAGDSARRAAVLQKYREGDDTATAAEAKGADSLLSGGQ